MGRNGAAYVKTNMHNTSTPRLKEIANGLADEGFYTIGVTIDQVADERDDLLAALETLVASLKTTYNGYETAIAAIAKAKRKS